MIRLLMTDDSPVFHHFLNLSHVFRQVIPG